MAMANIGGGSIVIGMDKVDNQWEPNGVDEEADARFQQDVVQQFVNGCADPYVELTVHHFDHNSKRFVIIEVLGFRELPIVCTGGSDPLSQGDVYTRQGSDSLRPGAVYTRSHRKWETVRVQSQLEMRELLDRAIAVGVQKWLTPVFGAMRDAGIGPIAALTDEEQFRAQRGDL